MPMPQNERPASFTGREEAALRSLLSDGSTSKAATAAGVNPSTVRRWLAAPRFRDEHRCRARLLADEALTDLLAAQKAAVATLRESLTAGTAATKVRAACCPTGPPNGPRVPDSRRSRRCTRARHGRTWTGDRVARLLTRAVRRTTGRCRKPCHPSSPARPQLRPWPEGKVVADAAK